MLNGNTIELGVCYYPEHWDTSFWKEDMLRMKSYGIGVCLLYTSPSPRD